MYNSELHCGAHKTNVFHYSRVSNYFILCKHLLYLIDLLFGTVKKPQSVVSNEYELRLYIYLKQTYCSNTVILLVTVNMH